MTRNAKLRLSPVPLLAVAAMLGSCATTSPTGSSRAAGWQPDRSFATRTADGPSVPTGRQDIVVPDRRQLHPPTMITAGLMIGEQSLETNTGDPNVGVLAASEAAVRFRLRGEHYFESGFGGLLEVYAGRSDGITLNEGFTADGEQDRYGLFLGAAYRATPNTSFRLPARFGPYIESTELSFPQSGLIDGGNRERSTLGFMLSAEPEFILLQTDHGDGRISELSTFVEIRAGAGPTNSKISTTDPADTPSDEDGYAFNMAYEIGVRYRWASGLMASLSYIGSKYHVATTESYNSAVIFGEDDDFNAIVLTGGWRF